MYLSNCCYEEIVMADQDGHGKCSDCGENCTPAEPENEELDLQDPFVFNPFWLIVLYFLL